MAQFPHTCSVISFPRDSNELNESWPAGNLWGQTWSALSADIAVAGKEEEEEANATAVPSGVERRRPPRSLSQLLRDRNYNVMDIMRT